MARPAAERTYSQLPADYQDWAVDDEPWFTRENNFTSADSPQFETILRDTKTKNDFDTALGEMINFSDIDSGFIGSVSYPKMNTGTRHKFGNKLE